MTRASRRGFFFWALAPFLIIFICVMAVIGKDESLMVRLAYAGMDLLAILFLLALFDSLRFRLAGRAAATIVIAAYVVYVVSTTWGFFSGRASVRDVVKSLGGLFFIGGPLLVYVAKSVGKFAVLPPGVALDHLDREDFWIAFESHGFFGELLANLSEQWPSNAILVFEGFRIPKVLRKFIKVHSAPYKQEFARNRWFEPEVVALPLDKVVVQKFTELCSALNYRGFYGVRIIENGDIVFERLKVEGGPVLVSAKLSEPCVSALGKRLGINLVRLTRKQVRRDFALACRSHYAGKLSYEELLRLFNQFEHCGDIEVDELMDLITHEPRPKSQREKDKFHAQIEELIRNLEASGN